MKKRFSLLIALFLMLCGMAVVRAETLPVSGAGRQDGERFEEVIMLEGMEETVLYEYVRNNAVGIELAYDCEMFVRRGGPDRECFISLYDDPEKPENYLEIRSVAEEADTVAASVSKTLSADYDIIMEPYTLERSGSCIRIDASAAKSGTDMSGLQRVYIIPAAGGCRVAAAHFTPESAEGFGARFDRILNTLTVID